MLPANVRLGKVIARYKHLSLFGLVIYNQEFFNTTDTSGLYDKSFTIVIYDRNDSGQYYKTTMLGS